MQSRVLLQSTGKFSLMVASTIIAQWQWPKTGSGWSRAKYMYLCQRSFSSKVIVIVRIRTQTHARVDRSTPTTEVIGDKTLILSQPRMQ